MAKVDATEADEKFEQLESGSVLATWALPIIIGYIAAGTAFFHYNEEEWEFLDAAYFCAVTLTTVGFGDLAPESDTSKMFAIGYIVGGLSIIATCLGLLASSVQGALDKLNTRQKVPPAQRYIGQVVRSIVLVCLVTGVGATFVHYNEGWSWLDSIYWSVVTSSTVGYGDLTILEESTRAFATGYVLVAAAVFAMALGRFGAVIMDIEADRNVDRFVARGVSIGMLKEMQGSSDGADSIGRIEFLQYMLVQMGKVDQDDLDKVLGMFDALDEDGSGSLDADDILALQRKRKSFHSRDATFPADPPAYAPPAAATPPPKTALGAMAEGTGSALAGGASAVRDGASAMARSLGLEELSKPLMGGNK